MGFALGSDLISGIYATADAHGAWFSLLDQVRRQLDVASAVATRWVERDRRLSQLWTARDTRSAQFASRHDRWINNPDNPRLGKSLSASPPSAIGSDRRLFADDPYALNRLNGGLTRAGLGQGFWVGFPTEEGQHLSIIFHRHCGELRDLRPEEESFLRDMLPHLKQAAALAQRIDQTASRATRLETALESVKAALLFCDAQLRVQWHSRAAASLLDRSTHISVSSTRLTCRRAADEAELRRQVEAVASGDAATAVVSIGAVGESPLHLRITRMAAAGAAPDGAVTIVFAEPEAPLRPEPVDLARLFSLTKAEAELAATMAAGASVTEAAAARGVTVGTARFQLKQILAKTGTRRQPELMQLLHRSSARTAPLSPNWEMP